MKVFRLYYRSARFMFLDGFLCLIYFFCNPYRICRKRGEVYGETPLTTLHRIVEKCNVQASDCWLDLGSGRGRGSFWVAQFVGCPVQGVEKIPFFLQIAKSLARLFRFRNLSFSAQLDFSSATVVYCYGTSWPEEQIDFFLQRMEALPKGARLISISFPFSETIFSPPIEFPVSFPWGDTTAYLQKKL